MKHISVLIPQEENNLSSIVGSYKMLTRANAIWSQKQGTMPYKVEL